MFKRAQGVFNIFLFAYFASPPIPRNLASNMSELAIAYVDSDFGIVSFVGFIVGQFKPIKLKKTNVGFGFGIVRKLVWPVVLRR